MGSNPGLEVQWNPFLNTTLKIKRGKNLTRGVFFSGEFAYMEV